jgi:Tfp pilus assembly protein PilF
MASSTTVSPPRARLARLLEYAEADPKNCALLADAAAAAYDERDYASLDSIIARYQTFSPLPPSLQNLKGLSALAQGKFDDAADILERVRTEVGDTSQSRLNLAWAKSGQRSYQDALALLDDEALSLSPEAPMLKIHVMHHLGLYEEAIACGVALAARFPDNEMLMGALATLAMDAERADLAVAYAQRAGNTAEGRTALGLLTLADHHADQALELFDAAIASQPNNPRAWIGKGLGLLTMGQPDLAAEAIDRGASLFGNHIGSWIASGWAHFIAGDLQGARASFDRAMDIDPNFSECHGGLAVLAIAGGNPAEAERYTEVALRLDRNCFGGALAKSLLLDRAGHSRAAQKVREIALTTPIGPSGRTIAQELVALGVKLPAKTGVTRQQPS